MARPIKKGSDYFPFDVGVLSDRKIKVLVSKYGADGFYLYIYLLCEIYKEGFYLAVDKDFNYIVSADLNMNDEKIGQMLNFLLERSLFNDKLFQSDKVLTSEGIQRRYQEMVKTKATKNTVTVESRFWLLSKEDTQSFIKVTKKDNYSENNPHYSENNPHYSENNPNKEKESKLKESKVNKNNNDVEDVMNHYYKSINPTPSTSVYVLMESYLNDGLTKDLIIDVLDYANDNNNRQLRYIKAILNNCINNKITTVEKFKENNLNYKSSSTSKVNKKTHDKVHNFEERNYNYDDLMNKIRSK